MNEPDHEYDWLDRCDLLTARDEILYFHRVVKSEGERRGCEYAFQVAYVTAWEAFRDNPTRRNAVLLIQAMPEIAAYFEISVREA